MRELHLPAIRVLQGGGRHVYTFAANGKDVCEFSAVSRLRSGGLTDVIGYQRPEVVRHIDEIRRYLEGTAPILPNAVVLAFDSGVQFEADAGTSADSQVVRGTLTVRWDPDGDSKQRPAWVVDGQQRLAAIREAELEQFSICVTAFVTDDADSQREQFLLLNNTKPLPKSLIYELLPGTGGLLPAALERKRLPALLTRRLNLESTSPFFRRIRLATNPVGVVRDNSVMRMLGHSLSDGALLRIRLQAAGGEEAALEEMLSVVMTFWSAVAETWPKAWALTPRKSRLLHGAGIVSLGFVMDEICELHAETGDFTEEMVRAELEQLKDVCFWTAGIWPFGTGRERRWNEVQNTSKDVNLLSNYLLRQYRIRVRDAARGACA